MDLVYERAVRTTLPLRRLERCFRRAETVLKLPRRTQVTLAFVNDQRIRQLNAWTRRIDRSTDVLSFPLHERRPFRPDADGVVRLGDIIVSVPTARRQARARGVSTDEEVVELAVHGLLHLVGLDHQHDRAARRMTAVAERILGGSR